MDQLEKQLGQALKHEDPPADFTAKVMARVAKEGAKPAGTRWLQFLWLPAYRAGLAGGLAAVMLIAAGGSVMYRQHQEERRRAEEARGQLMTALRITGSQLNRVSRVLSTSTVPAEKEE